MTTTAPPPHRQGIRPTRRSPVVRVARWSATRPWRALGLWLTLVVGAIALMAVVPMQSMSDDDYGIGESGRAAEMIRDAGLEQAPSEVVLITADSGALDRTAAEQAYESLRVGAEGVAHVEAVGPPVWAEDGSAMLVPLTLEKGVDDLDSTVEALQDSTAEVAAANPALDIAQTGGESIGTQVDERVGEDLSSGEMRSLPITFLIMIVAFGALIAAAIPVALAFSCVLTAMGLYAVVSVLVPDSGTVASVILMIGMAVGVDYSLFYLKREREERLKGATTIDAIEIAAATSGRAIIVAGFAVIVAMSGLLLTRDTVFAGLAIGAMLVVAVAMVGSVTVLPALLAKLGRWVDRPRVPGLWRLNRRIGTGGISKRLINPVLAHPKTSLAVSLGALVALSAPALGMTLHQGTIDTLPQGLPAVATFQKVQEHFPAERPTLEVVARGDSADTAAVSTALESLGAQAQSDGLAAKANPVVVSDDGRTSVLRLTAVGHEGDEGNEDAVTALRETAIPAALDDLDGVKWVVGGDVAETMDSQDAQRDALPLVVGFVLLLTMLMMWTVFRSGTVALLTTGLNLLSVGAAFGVMTLVFQNTWAEGMLNFTSPGFLVDWVPLFCFVILVGLSMDYHVFVMSRVREGMRRGLSTRLAVEYGVRETASVVTSAAAVMVSVFAVFATLSMLEMKQMGVGLSVAILVDATIVRLVLLPAALVLLDKRLGALRRPERTGERELVPTA
ncbi:MMPL family transporter [Mumia sp. ZJ1417]|uniref:MMPL family transporter n=1 Tax=Mumia sp. ZJ1417 TaxID=2708082 RepID=UPI0014234E50|nr:MMPL family transporter [Mumia sp. ZJ1417]QMW66807.1 MMPL family transporter [Mumia sp. ZJ1417]